MKHSETCASIERIDPCVGQGATMWRRIGVLAVLTGALALASCGDSEKLTKVQSQLKAHETKLSEARSRGDALARKLAAVEAKAKNLGAQISSISSADLKDNIDTLQKRLDGLTASMDKKTAVVIAKNKAADDAARNAIAAQAKKLADRMDGVEKRVSHDLPALHKKVEANIAATRAQFAAQAQKLAGRIDSVEKRVSRDLPALHKKVVADIAATREQLAALTKKVDAEMDATSSRLKSMNSEVEALKKRLDGIKSLPTNESEKPPSQQKPKE